MRSRILIYVGVLAILAQVTAAQSIAPGVPDTIKKTAASKKWRTPWGDPDLQGSLVERHHDAAAAPCQVRWPGVSDGGRAGGTG
jgi:hypothetical protein